MAVILLVDDDQDFLQIAQKLLEVSRIEAIACTNAIDALEKAQQIPFDAIVTDANMTPINGYDFIKSIKKLAGYDIIPIAMITGRRERRDVERALAVGVQDYIVKPIDPEQFIGKVQALIEQNKSTQKNLRFAELETNEKAKAGIELRLIGVSEASALLTSDHALAENTIFSLQAETFMNLGIHELQLQVNHCLPSATDGAFEIRCSYMGLSNRNLAKIRQYVLSKVKTHHPNSRAA